MNVAVSQAMACGLPIIATRHSGFPEQVHDGTHGFLVPEGNPIALSERILFLIEHSELWADMGREARAHVEKHYNAEAAMEKQIEVYRQLTEE